MSAFVCIRVYVCVFVCVLVHVLRSFRECGDEVDWHWEDDRRALLRRDLAERLKVTKLKGSRRFVDDVCGVFQGLRRFLFSLRRDHLQQNRCQNDGCNQRIRAENRSGTSKASTYPLKGRPIVRLFVFLWSWCNIHLIL